MQAMPRRYAPAKYFSGAALTAHAYQHEALVDELVFCGPSLLKIYKKNGGPLHAPCVAVMDPTTRAHVAYLAVTKLTRTLKGPEPERYSAADLTHMLHSVS